MFCIYCIISWGVLFQVKKEVGDVGILINNAGIVTGKKFIDSPDSLVEKTMEVNIMAHFWVIPVLSIYILKHPFNMFPVLILPFGIEVDMQGYTAPCRFTWK